MYRNNSFIAVIPARAGSKRLPRKNMRLIVGKPLIYWSIKAAKESGIFDEIVVMSDGVQILDFARKNGVNAYPEPTKLAADDSYVGVAIKEMLSPVEDSYDYVQLIEPTNPLIRPAMIKNAVDFLLDKDADFVIGMCDVGCPCGVAKALPFDLCVTDWWPDELFGKRTQDCKSAYKVSGSIYVGKWDLFVKDAMRTYWKSKIYAFVHDKYDSVDVDDKWDLQHAEIILQSRLKGK